jgi:hypothetical protein
VALVWAADTGMRNYGTFIPSEPVARDLLPFFPQYAQSLSLWSPDSAAFAFSGEIGGERGVWVQELAESQPRLVAEGTWVAWSGG